jgi:hypothetical protein
MLRWGAARARRRGSELLRVVEITCFAPDAILPVTEIEVLQPPVETRELKDFPPRLLCRKTAPVAYW